MCKFRSRMKISASVPSIFLLFFCLPPLAVFWPDMVQRKVLNFFPRLAHHESTLAKCGNSTNCNYTVAVTRYNAIRAQGSITRI